jgi:hypothetical protein
VFVYVGLFVLFLGFFFAVCLYFYLSNFIYTDLLFKTHTRKSRDFYFRLQFRFDNGKNEDRNITSGYDMKVLGLPMNYC